MTSQLSTDVISPDEAHSASPGILSSLLNGPVSHTPPADSVRRNSLVDTRGNNPGFSAADKSLIRKVHGYMAPVQLLGILNQRLVCDVGVDVALHSLDQLKAEITSATALEPVATNDWASLRKLLAKARREGVLDLINEQVINDFAVVFSLNQKQVMSLKDILLNGDDQ